MVVSMCGEVVKKVLRRHFGASRLNVSAQDDNVDMGGVWKEERRKTKEEGRSKSKSRSRSKSKVRL